MLDNTVRLTKSGKPVWLTQEIRFNAILSEMRQQGYTFALSMENLKKNKFFIPLFSRGVSEGRGVYFLCKFCHQ